MRKTGGWLIAILVSAAMTIALRGQEKATRPRLILVLSVDQMRYDYLTRLGTLYKGGLRLLLDRGAVFSQARLRHGIPLLSVGLSRRARARQIPQEAP